MKRTIKHNVLLLMAASLMTVTITAGGRKDTSAAPAGPGTASGEGRAISINYDIERTNPGTRSEGRNHKLVINGKIVPDTFDLVFAADVLYEFKVKAQPWGDAGYMRIKNGAVPYGRGSGKISDKDWELGWYEGDKLKEGTPRSWVYVTRGRESYFVSPDEIYRLVRYKVWSFRERDSTEPVKR